MSLVRRAGLLMAAGLFAVACGGGGQPTTAPSTNSTNPTPAATTATETSGPATEQPSAGATAESTAAATAGTGVLDPSQSDANVVGRVKITNDERGHRDGTYDIVGVKDDGFISGCSYSFEGDEFTAVAFYDAAPEGQIHQMAVVVSSDNIPDGDDTVTGIEDGRAYIDFVSESGFGTAYVGEPENDDRTSVSIDVTRSGDLLTFDYDGLTWDQIPFTGQMVCGEVS